MRAEIYNVFNTVHFGFPVTDVTNASFGLISSLNTLYMPRTVQIAVRYRY